MTSRTPPATLKRKRAYLVSGDATWELFDEGKEFQRTRQVQPVCLEDEIVSGSTTKIIHKFRTLPLEISHMIVDALIAELIAVREFGLACEVASRVDRTISHRWTRRFFGSDKPYKPVQSASQFGGWFMLLTTLYEEYDRELPAELVTHPIFQITRDVPVFTTMLGGCSVRYDPCGVQPQHMVERCDVQGKGMEIQVRRRSRLILNTHPADEVSIWNFTNKSRTGTLTWRGTRVCDAMLHNSGLRGDGVLATDVTLAPFLLLKLERDTATCSLCKMPKRIGRHWMMQAASWRVFAECIELAFMGAQLLLHVSWDQIDTPPGTPYIEPIGSSGVFVRPLEVEI